MSNIQNFINTAADELSEAYNNRKAAKEGMKELKSALKKRLEEDSKYLELLDREKKLKQARKELSEDIKEINKAKEQMAMDTDEQGDLDDFINNQDEKFIKIQDRVVGKLSNDLSDEGMVAEVNYKNGQLILVVARA